jgi:hypothetical protein
MRRTPAGFRLRESRVALRVPAAAGGTELIGPLAAAEPRRAGKPGCGVRIPALNRMVAGSAPIPAVHRACLTGAAALTARFACDSPACSAVDYRAAALAAVPAAAARSRAEESATGFVRPVLTVARAPITGLAPGAPARAGAFLELPTASALTALHDDLPFWLFFRFRKLSDSRTVVTGKAQIRTRSHRRCRLFRGAWRDTAAEDPGCTAGRQAPTRRGAGEPTAMDR